MTTTEKPIALCSCDGIKINQLSFKNLRKVQEIENLQEIILSVVKKIAGTRNKVARNFFHDLIQVNWSLYFKIFNENARLGLKNCAKKQFHTLLQTLSSQIYRISPKVIRFTNQAFPIYEAQLLSPPNYRNKVENLSSTVSEVKSRRNAKIPLLRRDE